MAEPVVFVSHFAVKPGALEAYQRFQRQAMGALERDKPRTLAFLIYLDEGGSNMSIVHVFGDAEAMDLHFEGAAERARSAYEYIEPRGWDIYGKPSDAALETMRQAAQSAGVSLRVQPAYAGGFQRFGDQVAQQGP